MQQRNVQGKAHTVLFRSILHKSKKFRLFKNLAKSENPKEKHFDTLDPLSPSDPEFEESRETSIQSIPPVPTEYIQGELKDWTADAGIVTGPVDGVWWSKERLETDDHTTGSKRLLALHFHGGGYRFGDATDEQSGFSRIPRDFVQRDIFACVLSIDYTLTSSNVQTPSSFPLQLVQALSGYYYLIRRVGISPSCIVLTGDSAGGHLALCLLRYILASHCLGTPGGIVLFSPWCEMDDPSRPSIKALLGSLAPTLTGSPYLSPSLHRPLPGWPPTFISSGLNEFFATSIASLETQLSSAGVQVTWHQTDTIPIKYSHDFLIHNIVERVWPDKIEECWRAIQEWVVLLYPARAGV